MTVHQFQLVGGDPALDFLNTIHDWTAEEPNDYLPDFGEALRFGEAAGVVLRAESRRLTAVRGGESEMRRLRELRGRLERIFRAVAEERSPAAADLDQLARDFAEAAVAFRFGVSRSRVTRAVDADAAGPALLRWRLVEAATALLTSGRVERMKSCPSCGWFFL